MIKLNKERDQNPDVNAIYNFFISVHKWGKGEVCKWLVWYPVRIRQLLCRQRGALQKFFEVLEDQKNVISV